MDRWIPYVFFYAIGLLLAIPVLLPRYSDDLNVTHFAKIIWWPLLLTKFTILSFLYIITGKESWIK